MTMRVMDGFDYLPATGFSGTLMNAANWYAAGYIMGEGMPGGSVAGAYGFGRAIRWTSITNGASNMSISGIVKYIGVDRATGFISATFWRGANGDTGGPALAFYDLDGNSPQIVVWAGLFGTIKVYRGGTFLVASDPGVFADQNDFTIEVKATIDDVAGAVEVRINGKTVINLIDADTKNSTNAYFNGVAVGQRSDQDTDNDNRIDNVYCYDTDGSINNDWLGTNRVKTQFMTANGSHVDSAIGGTSPLPTNWQSVGNLSLNNTAFVYEPTIGEYDLYVVDPNLNAPVVHAVQVTIGARQDDATQRTIATMVKSGATLSEGTGQNTSESYRHYYQILETDPNTSVGWVDTAANAIEVGFKVTA